MGPYITKDVTVAVNHAPFGWVGSIPTVPTNTTVLQMAERADSDSVQCEFESREWYQYTCLSMVGRAAVNRLMLVRVQPCVPMQPQYAGRYPTLSRWRQRVRVPWVAPILM